MNLTDAEILARKLILEHAPDWRFAWMPRAKHRFGECRFGPQASNGKYLTRTICLSRPLTEINSQAVVEQVVLHEIAHVMAGPNVPDHGRVWKAHARRLGIPAKTCVQGAEIIEGNVIVTCPECGVSFRQHKVTWALFKRQACAHCLEDFGRVVRFTITRADGTPIPCPKKPAPRRRRRRRS